MSLTPDPESRPLEGRDNSTRDAVTAPPVLCVGVVTISDRASAGTYEDRSGPAICRELTTHIDAEFEIEQRLVVDERGLIAATIVDLVDRSGCHLVVTTGGTGPALRDVTPEATGDACDRVLPGFGELMRSVSLRVTPTAILSRQLAGLRGSALVLNLPGSPGSITDCLQAVLPAIPYCIELAGGPWFELTGGLLAHRPGRTPSPAARPELD